VNNTSDTTIGYIKITNKRKNVGPKPTAGETAVDGDRDNPVLGNKHILKNHLDPVERAKVIAAYRDDYVRDCSAQGPMFKATQALAERVSKGEKIALQCWCAGIGPCHLQIVVDKASEMLGCSIEKK